MLQLQLQLQPQLQLQRLLQLQLQLQLHQLQLQLHYKTTTTTNATAIATANNTLHYALNHTTSSSCGRGDRCNHSKKTHSNHLSVHQWIRLAIHASEQLTSPIVSYLWSFRHRLVRYYGISHHLPLYTHKILGFIWLNFISFPSQAEVGCNPSSLSRSWWPRRSTRAARSVPADTELWKD